MGSDRGFQSIVRVVSAWLVALLVVIAAQFLIASAELGGGLRAMWYTLSAVATVRACVRSHVAVTQR